MSQTTSENEKKKLCYESYEKNGFTCVVLGIEESEPSNVTMTSEKLLGRDLERNGRGLF